MTQMSTVQFIRHAENESNAGWRTSYPEEVKLTLKGVEHAKDIASSLEDIAFSLQKEPSLIITSDYRYAKQTAQPTIKQFRNVRCEEWRDVREFAYLSRPALYNTTKQDRRPKVAAFWDKCDPTIRNEGAESFVDFMSRVQGVLERLRYLDEELVFVFSHGQFIQAALWLLERKPTEMSHETMKDFRCYLVSSPISNGDIRQVQFLGRDTAQISKVKTPRLHEDALESFIGDERMRSVERGHPSKIDKCSNAVYNLRRANVMLR